MLRVSLLICVVVAFCIPSNCASRDWKTGKILSFNQEGWASHGSSTTSGTIDEGGSFNATTTQTSWHHETYYLAIEDETFIYFAERTLSFRFQHSPKITENADAKYAIEKDSIYVLDDGGREFKMSIIKRRKK